MARPKRPATADSVAEHTPNPVLPAKRPRGRPRKYPKKPDESEKSDIVTSPMPNKEQDTTALVQELSQLTKTTTDASSSPVPKTHSDGKFVSTLVKTGPISVQDIVSAKSPEQLDAFIAPLIFTDQDQLFSEYRELSSQKQADDAQEIEELKKQLDVKQATIDALAAEIQELRNTLERNREIGSRTPSKSAAATPQRDMYESPIRRKESSDSMVDPSRINDEFKTIAFTLDMLELLTGVRVLDYSEDPEQYIFDVRQSSTLTESENEMVCIEYQLLIQRNFDIKAEVTYVPVFLDALNEHAHSPEETVKHDHAERVKLNLPSYLQQRLDFPYNTLSQFYSKLSKALNKSTKRGV